MSDVVINVEGLGKLHRLDLSRGYSRLSERLADLVRSPGQPFKKKETAERSFWALKDVTFDVKQGEVFGLIGRNGAGKSTLLKILSRITDPTEGQAMLKGRIGSLLEVGVGFHPELTGRENIFLNGAILGMRKSEITAKFDEIVQFAEVEKFIDSQIKRYSSGMYVRLAFAVAAHLQPDILIVDEVLAVGDASFQKKCLGKLGQVSTEEGKTVLFVSHDLAAISSLCNRVLILNKGKMEAIGAPPDMVSHYLASVFSFEEEALDELRVARGYYGVDVRFSDLMLTSGDGNGSLMFGEPLEITAIVETPKELHGLSMGATIVSRAGVAIMTVFSEESFSIKSGQKVRVVLKMSNLRLVPGQYYVQCSLGRGGYDSPRIDLDLIDGRPTFQILPVSNDGQKLFNWQDRWGHVAHDHVSTTIETL